MGAKLTKINKAFSDALWQFKNDPLIAALGGTVTANGAVLGIGIDALRGAVEGTGLQNINPAVSGTLGATITAAAVVTGSAVCCYKVNKKQEKEKEKL